MYLISDLLFTHLIYDGESPYEIIPIAFQLIEEIMRIEENEKGQLYWVTDYDQDVLYILCKMKMYLISLSLYSRKWNNMDLKVYNLCNTELNSLANPMRKSSLAGKSGADTS